MIRICLAALAVAASTAALAQTPERTAQVKAGQEVRIALIVAVKPDCTSGQLADLQIVTAPGNGSLLIRSGETTLPANAPRCPNARVPAQAVFYKAKPDFAGTDRVVLETIAQGKPQPQAVKVTVSK